VVDNNCWFNWLIKFLLLWRWEWPVPCKTMHGLHGKPLMTCMHCIQCSKPFKKMATKHPLKSCCEKFWGKLHDQKVFGKFWQLNTGIFDLFSSLPGSVATTHGSRALGQARWQTQW
jgi:hypothetical protein